MLLLHVYLAVAIVVTIAVVYVAVASIDQAHRHARLLDVALAVYRRVHYYRHSVCYKLCWILVSLWSTELFLYQWLVVLLL